MPGSHQYSDRLGRLSAILRRKSDKVKVNLQTASRHAKYLVCRLPMDTGATHRPRLCGPMLESAPGRHGAVAESGRAPSEVRGQALSEYSACPCSIGRLSSTLPCAINLHHALVSTTSIYLHGDDRKRARQLSAAFAPRD